MQSLQSPHHAQILGPGAAAVIGAVLIFGVVDFEADLAGQLQARYAQLTGSLSIRLYTQRSGPAIFGQTVAMVPTPVADAHPALLIATDIRLDGRRELARTVQLSPDCGGPQLLAACWARWGPDCVHHLHGDYAFVVVSPSAQTLWLVRDPMGQRPLFVRRMDTQIVFASCLRPLRLLGANPGADATALADHLCGLPGDPDRTAWQGIERVPAGHVCRFENHRDAASGPAGGAGHWRAHRFAALQPPVQSATLSESDWREGFKARFNAAILDRLGDAERIGATFSGGLDSSAVVASASVLSTRGDLRAYAARFPQTPQSDEGQYIEDLRNFPGVHVEDIDVSATSPLRSYAELLPALDEPVLIQNLHLWSSLYAAARADGIRVMLDGHDGDSALGRSAATDPSPAPARASLRVRTLRRLRELLGGAPAETSVPIDTHLMNADFARTTQAAERQRDFARRRLEASSAGMLARHRWQLCSGYAQYATERLSSIAQAFEIEARHPFYDVRLLEWCLGLPAALRQRDGYSRWVLRAELAGVLPDRLRWRPGKTSLSPQFHRAFAGMDAQLVEPLLQPDGDLAQYLDVEKLRALWNDYQRQPSDRASVSLWSAATLGVWLQSHAA